MHKLCDLFKKNKKPLQIDMNNIPKHIGFIMDGNGRWATKRGLPRSFGHREGVNALTRVLDYCFELGVEVVSVFAFSTENFKRDKAEVDYIFELIKEFIVKKADDAVKKDTQIKIMGDYFDKRVPKDVQNALTTSIEKTKNCKKHILNIGFIYGGRAEIVNAVNNIIKDNKKSVSEEEFSKYLLCFGKWLIVSFIFQRHIGQILIKIQ
jgi:undecaprenyl diphosphate synthase